MIILENEFLTVKAKREGAELTSIFSKVSKIEYLWQGDPTYWRFHAPICFPIIGRLIEDTCFVDSKAYNMTVHGFARDMIFDVLHQEKDSVSFILKANDETLKLYPYNFSLILSYKLEGNKIIFSYEVKNEDSKDMYFSIGAHTAFNCPIDTDINLEDYYISFKKKQNVEAFMLEGGYLLEKKRTLGEEIDKIKLSTEVFKNDVIILENLKESEMVVGTEQNNHSVKVSFEGFPYVAIWSKPTGAPFVCIEPWFGLPDLCGSSRELKDKKAIQKLEVNKTFKCKHEVILN